MSLLRLCPLLLTLSLPALLATPAEDLRALTGAPTRVVWVQDAGDTAAVYSERPTLRLMGLDTEDNKGERAILPDIARYSKPIITDDGTRVAFGDLDKQTVNVVNWDGTGLRTVLTHAEFQDVWTDPRTGIDWIYAKVEEQRGDKTAGVIRRYRLDDSSVSELIWDKTPVFNFMVNGDGRAASGGVSDGGNTPQGIFLIPNGGFAARAGGCWPSMSPDNSLRSWVFTGSHRSIHFGVTTDRSGKGYSYGVEFNKSPGLTVTGQEELYHPRWSNDIRFITATAPLYNWSYSAAAKIPNDVAEKVEIYLGKFTNDMHGIERWVKVTDNHRGDYWPDAWVKPAPGAPAWMDSEPSLAAGTNTAAEPDHTAQVFLWNTGADSNQLIDAKTGAIRQCGGQLHGDARFARYNVLDLSGGSFVPDDTAGPWLQAVKTGGAFAFEAVLTPAADTPNEGVLLAFSADLNQGNLVLAQQDGWLTLRLRGREGAPLQLVRLSAGQPSHVIVSYVPGNLAVYVNGQLVVRPDAPVVPVSTWTPQPLLLGDAASGGHDWAGRMEGIGLFGRVIAQAEARQRFDAYTERVASRPKQTARAVVQAKLIGTCPPADPRGIAPYKRCLSVQQYQITEVIEGEVADKIISVAQWSVLDAKVVPAYLQFKKGQSYRLVLESWSDHPEQESERMINGDFEEEGELYYEMRPEPAIVTQAINTSATIARDAVWNTVSGQANVQRLDGPVAIVGEGKPTLFAAGADGKRDTAGNAVTLEAGSLPEILVSGALRLGGDGSIKGGRVLDGGLGYLSAPALQIVGGEGQGAQIFVSMSVTGLDLVQLGSGYTEVPKVEIATPDIYGGRQAVAVAYLDKDSGALARLIVTDGGSGYLRSPAVKLIGGGGKDAAVQATLSLSDIYVVKGGKGYTAAPQIEIKGGGGNGAEACAVLQLTVLRYTDSQGSGFVRNTGTIDQDGAALLFDWAADGNNTGVRGFENSGQWIMRNGALVQYMSSSGRPYWGTNLTNSGTLRLLSGSRLGMQKLVNTGTLQLGAGAVLGQVNYAGGEMALNNTGEVQVSGTGENVPVVFGQIDPERNGTRTINNGDPTIGAKARFTLGDGNDKPVFRIAGGNSYFINHSGATTLINSGSVLSLTTNDNGSQHLFISRDAKLTNNGDLLLAGFLLVQGNHAGFMGMENTGRLFIRGTGAGIDRQPNSAGPGSFYGAEETPARILNLTGGSIQGDGTFTYVNSTGNDGARYLRLINLGGISPGSDQPGKLNFVDTNIEFGAVPPSEDEKKQSTASLAGAGLLRILVGGSTNYSVITLSGKDDSGRFTLVDGAANTLNIVATGATSPRGRFRIVTATSVKGTFANLQFNGKSPVPYTVNYLADGIEVVFP